MNASSTGPQLPLPVSRFFADETTDPRVLAEYLSPDAVVQDEGHRHVGPAAIARWRAAAIEKYRSTNEPLSAETSGTLTTVTVRVTGSFPNSPIQLRFRFTVAEDRICRLEIAA